MPDGHKLTLPIHPRVLREELEGLSAIQRNLRLKELFGEPVVGTPPAPESALRPPVPMPPRPKPAAAGPQPTMAPARLRESLKGLTGADRAAKLAELFNLPQASPPRPEGVVVIGDSGDTTA